MREVPPWIPDPLRELGPAGLAWWQWLGILLVAAVALFVGRIAAVVLRKILTRLVARTSVTWDDQLLRRLDRPLLVLVATLLVHVGWSLLDLGSGAEGVTQGVVFAMLGVSLVWGLFAIVDVIVERSAAAPWAIARPASRALVLLGGRVVKVVIVIIGLISLLGGLGIPIASLVAGLGIGGIALAFGAQKTVENLFGAFAIGVDQPLREGDFIRVDDVLGTVEAVGLRSTRIRTLDRTIVSLPNGRLADMQIETFALRDRCRMHAVLGVTYSTRCAQLRTLLDGFEQVLRAHPGIWPDDVVVRFVAFGSSSLDIEVMAWFQTGDYGQFRTWRQEVLLGFIDVVERVGTSFAFPTQTVHVESLPPVRVTRGGDPP
jgi:MscS family membrane protein